MTAAHARQSPTAIATRPRKIVRRTRGNRHGPITRLMSPGDLGQLLKPFVFLDLFDMDTASFPGIGLHPHSGIATVTYLFEGSVRYKDTSGATGVLRAGGLEWFKAGGGAWHGGGPGDGGRSRGFQLWRYQPAIDHTVGWVALSTGRLLVPERVEAGELAIFESSADAIDFHADADTEFVLGSAAPHAHDLVLGQYSVHSSLAMLRAGEQQLSEIQRRLQNEGRL